MIDLDFPWIYVWDCNDIKGLNVTKVAQENETNLQLEETRHDDSK